MPSQASISKLRGLWPRAAGRLLDLGHPFLQGLGLVLVVLGAISLHLGGLSMPQELESVALRLQVGLELSVSALKVSSVQRAVPLLACGCGVLSHLAADKTSQDGQIFR